MVSEVKYLSEWVRRQERPEYAEAATQSVITFAHNIINWSTTGVHIADLPTKELSSGTSIMFTFYRPQAGRWEKLDYGVVVE